MIVTPNACRECHVTINSDIVVSCAASLPSTPSAASAGVTNIYSAQRTSELYRSLRSRTATLDSTGGTAARIASARRKIFTQRQQSEELSGSGGGGGGGGVAVGGGGGGGGGGRVANLILDTFRPRSKSDATRNNAVRKPNLFAMRKPVSRSNK